MRLEMTQAEYARHRGVKRQTVHKLISSQRISLEPSEDGSGRMIIDVAAADRALGETRERILTRDDAAPSHGDYVAPGAIGGLTKARTATEVYRARLAQLEYDERVGRLLSREDVERSMRLCAESMVRDLELIVSAAPELASAFRRGEEPELRTALKAMIRRVQATMAENLRILTTPSSTADAAPSPAALS